MTSAGQLKANAIHEARENIGRHVIIVNSMMNPEFNGRSGIITDYEFFNDMYRVQIDDTQEVHNFTDAMFDYVGFTGIT